jgi:hypothetical protein
MFDHVTTLYNSFMSVCVFTVYLTTLLIAQTVCTDNELKRVWNNAVGSNLRHFPGIFLEGLRKTTEKLIRKPYFWAEIWIWSLSNAKLDCELLGSDVLWFCVKQSLGFSLFRVSCDYSCSLFRPFSKTVVKTQTFGKSTHLWWDILLRTTRKQKTTSPAGKSWHFETDKALVPNKSLRTFFFLIPKELPITYLFLWN